MDSPPPPPSGRPAKDLRELLLDAAWDILQEPDTPLDLRKVAERAGKSRTAPYLVFGKESEGGGVLGLRIAVAARGAQLMHAQMEAAARGVDDPLDAFHRVALAFLDFVADHRRLFRLIYGPEIDAVARLGEDGFREHPEFRQLFDFRSRAGSVVSRLIHHAQDRGLLRPDGGAPHSDSRVEHPGGPRGEAGGESPGGDEPPGSPLETPSARYLQIAWSTMIGMVVLRDDQLLHSIGWRITREQGARLIVESVFGLDPQVVEDATRTFMASHGVATPVRSAAAPPPELELRVGEARAPVEEFREVVDDADDRVFGAPVDDPDDRVFGAPVDDPDDDTFGAVAHDQAGHASGDLFDNLDEDLRPAEGPPTMTVTQALESYSGLRRAAFSDRLRNRPRILWIDDHPDSIATEVDTLERLGAEVTLARNTHEATRVLQRVETGAGRRAPFQAIVSDIARGSRADAGVRALPELRRLAPGVPVIFFVSAVDHALGVPKGATGITDRTDELLHLVVDALEGR